MGGESTFGPASTLRRLLPAASTGKALAPQERVHLHNRDRTWCTCTTRASRGDICSPTWIRVGASYLAADEGRILADGAGKTLKFVLNGRPETSVHNVPIASGDRLLVSYGAGTAPEVIQKQFPTVASDVPRCDQRKDPAGCSGSLEPTFWDRLRHAVIG